MSDTELIDGNCPGCGLSISTHVKLTTPNAALRYCPQCGEKVTDDDR